METMIENYINGNIATAKKQALRFNQERIRIALVEWGFSSAKAGLTAAHLKGSDCWQAVCDAD